MEKPIQNSPNQTHPVADAGKSPTQAAPIGLNMETIAEKALQVKKATRDTQTESQDTVSTAVEAVELAIRQQLRSRDGELEVAHWMHKVADSLESGGHKEMAEAIQQRSSTIVAKTLNQMDGFDR